MLLPFGIAYIIAVKLFFIPEGGFSRRFDELKELCAAGAALRVYVFVRWRYGGFFGF